MRAEDVGSTLAWRVGSYHIEVLEARQLLSGDAQMVQNINSFGASSNLTLPGATVGNFLLYKNTTAGGGTELWRSDGTASGTRALVTINSAPNATVLNMTTVGSLVFFSADDGVHGLEPWRSDGTPSGTFMLKDAAPGIGSSSATGFVSFAGTTYFITGGGLWKTDGSAAGTVAVKVVDSYSPSGLIVFNGALFFTAWDAAHGNELWKSDGSTGGTALLKDIVVGTTDSVPEYFTVAGSQLFFQAGWNTDSELWKTDGTTAGTVLVKNINPNLGSLPVYLTAVGDTLFFADLNSPVGDELWKSDGTSAGTVVVKDITNISGLSPFNLINVDGTLYFTGDDGVHGRELWKSDGTLLGTVMVSDLQVGTVGSGPQYLQVVDGTLMFRADDGIHGNELWKVDPATDQCALVKDIWSGPNGSIYAPMQLTTGIGSIGDVAYFGAYTPATGFELWKSDGTEAGTLLVADSSPSEAGSGPTSLTSYHGKLYFSADDGISGVQLWASDGSSSGTTQVTDVATGSLSAAPREMVVFNDQLFFFADWRDPSGAGGTAMFKTDGTDAGTSRIMNLTSPSMLQAAGDSLYFVATNSSTSTLWRSDGTASGTTVISSSISNPSQYLSVNGHIFVVARQNTTAQLWMTDGTPAGTTKLKTFIANTSVTDLTSLGPNVYFTASDNPHGAELWRSDGTLNGTTVLDDINIGTAGSNPTGLTAFGAFLYFAADDGIHGAELWQTDGTTIGTVLVDDLSPGTASSNPASLTVSANRLFFTATDSYNRLGIWATDGSPGGGKLLNFFASLPTSLVDVGGTLFFSATLSSNGNDELWRSDGSTDGTEIVTDVCREISNVTVLDGAIFFTATDGNHGAELWQYQVQSPSWLVASADATFSLIDSKLNITGGTITLIDDADSTDVDLEVAISGSARLAVQSSQHWKSFRATDQSTALVAPGSHTIVVGSVAISSAGILDLADSSLIIDYDDASPIPSIDSLVFRARAGGSWTGAGITSSTVRDNPKHNTTLGVIEASDYKSISALNQTFDGEAIDNTAVLVKYTYYGDADFNGKVDGSDYARIDRTFNREIGAQPISGWLNGDFDGNGKVDGGDYSLIDLAFNSQGSTLRGGVIPAAATALPVKPSAIRR